eukprot:TRINITY_DN14340_c0_g1_i2.p1 TRINITY_DN14340_c0_g1~~TRINITY_DN14340_c0_g1_i2.p1  ORF type:complete len:390 (+),score=59.12 TRINITY_DN14340_c0_g1_i2:35-1204(+)
MVETPGPEEMEELFEQASFQVQRTVRRVSALARQIGSKGVDHEALQTLREHIAEEANFFVETATLLELVLRRTWCQLESGDDQQALVLRALQLLDATCSIELKKAEWVGTVKDADWELLRKFAPVAERSSGPGEWIHRHRYVIAGVCAASAAAMGYLLYRMHSATQQPISHPPDSSLTRTQTEVLQVPFPLAPIPMPHIDSVPGPVPQSQPTADPKAAVISRFLAAGGGVSMLAAGLVLSDNMAEFRGEQTTRECAPQLRSRFCESFAALAERVRVEPVTLQQLVDSLLECHMLNQSYQQFTDLYSCQECCICLGSMGPEDDLVCSAAHTVCRRFHRFHRECMTPAVAVRGCPLCGREMGGLQSASIENPFTNATASAEQSLGLSLIHI